MPAITVGSAIPVGVGLASKTCSAAFGYTPTMPTPFSGAAAIDATSVPWNSAGPRTDWSLKYVVFGRFKNSGCEGSTPLSTIVIGTPGPGGGGAAVAPIAESHHSCGSSGSDVTRTPAAAAAPQSASAAAATARRRRAKTPG